MLDIHRNYPEFRIVGIILAVLLLIAGCRMNSATVGNSPLVPNVSQPVRVSSGNAAAAEPAIAASPDGGVYVVWVDHSPGSEADVMIARFSADGRTHASTVRINSQPGVATAWRGDPPTVAVAPDQTIYVGWTARVESESGSARDLYLSSSKDHGQTFAPPVRVNDDTKPAAHGMHSLAIGTDGHVYLAWLDERNISPMEMKDSKMGPGMKGHHMESNSELFFSSSVDGGRTFAPNERVATDVCPCCKTALAVGSDNRVYLSWRQVLPGDLRHIAVSSSIDGGKAFSKPIIVSDDQWILAGCPVSGSTLSVDSDGILSVLWYSAGKNGETGLYWTQSKDHGATFGSRRLVNVGTTKGTPVLLSAGKGLAGVWESNEKGTTEVLTANLSGERTPAESFVLATTGELPAAAVTKDRMFIAYIANNESHQDVWLVTRWNRQD
jgi:hypothetical protein